LKLKALDPGDIDMPTQQHSPALLASDQSASVIQRLHGEGRRLTNYSPFGFHFSDLAGISIGFNGQPYDPSVQGYLLGNGYRVFNVVLQRFNIPDSVSPFSTGGINAYAYCAGDPINASDPSGHTWLWLKKTLRFFGAMSESTTGASRSTPRVLIATTNISEDALGVAQVAISPTLQRRADQIQRLEAVITNRSEVGLSNVGPRRLLQQIQRQQPSWIPTLVARTPQARSGLRQASTAPDLTDRLPAYRSQEDVPGLELIDKTGLPHYLSLQHISDDIKQIRSHRGQTLSLR
jgi:RHS repeat-associated protein